MSEYNPESDKKIIVANCGGDGTLLRNILDFKSHGIDVSKCSYVTLPFGSANDLPRHFGWGKAATRRMLTDMDHVMDMLQNDSCQ